MFAASEPCVEYLVGDRRSTHGGIIEAYWFVCIPVARLSSWPRPRSQRLLL